MFVQLEKNLRGRGKEALADAVKALHELNGSDIPWPEKESAHISRFSAEQRKELERKGYLVYSLTGRTIAAFREAGYPFLSTWHQWKSIEQVRSTLTEVATNPNNFFLLGSCNKTLHEQQAMVEEFGRNLSREVKGVTAILGTAPDYVELAFLHRSATGKRLFGEDYDYHYTRTTTPATGYDVALVGSFDADGGLSLQHLRPRTRGSVTWAAPLVVPTAAVGS